MMNKKLNHLLSLVMVLLCTVGMVSAQQIVNIPGVGNAGTFGQFNGPNTFYNFYDSGGSAGNYGANNNGIVSFAPQTAGAKVQAVFSIFQTETNFDALYCFDGTTTGAPKIVGPAGAPLGNNVYGTGGFWSSANNPAAAPSNVAPGTVRATAANASGALTFAFTSDGSGQYQGWAAVVTQFIPCNPVPGPALAVGLSPGVCVANLNVALPATYNPAGCINDVNNNLRYILDANPAVNIPKPLPATVTINNIPSGAHVITWQVYNGSGAVLGQATQNLQVNDTEAPVLNCPSDIIINLDPGLCCSYVSWGEVTATDNCPFVGPVMTYNFKVYMRNGAFGPNMGSNAGWTLVADAGYNVTGAFVTGGGSNVVIPFTTQFTIPAGQVSGLYYVIDNGTTLNRRIMYNSTNTTTNDGNIQIMDGAGINAGIFTGIAFQPRGAYISVNYQLGGEAEVIKDFGPDSGAELCKDDSPWVVQYSAEDVAGNVGTCSFSIQVLEYASPVTKLSCNDNVQISLDEDCVTEVGADDVLEGGPYGCYDDYVVTIYNANNTPLASSPNVGRPQIGGTWKVKVTDPETGNSCWGLISVEDKLAPVMECTDFEVNCGDEIEEHPAPAIFQAEDPLFFPTSFLAHGGGTAFSLQGNTLPGGVYFNITNNSASPLQITGFGIRFGNPQFGMVNAPQTMEVWTAPTFVGNETNMAAWTNLGPYTIDVIPPYFATGTGDLAQLDLSSNVTIPAGETRGFHVWGATACPIFNYFNGTAPVTNGPFTVAGGPISLWSVEQPVPGLELLPCQTSQ
ncbi:MAG: hypothetical protein IPJ06_06530 [Saprospiraceae bacterium]|nr:hypothetical protein [Saprospiraceae bacterium]